MPKTKYRMRRHPVTQPSDPSYRIIPLTKGQNALIDTEDYERVNRWNWAAHWAKCTKSFYADREESGTTISMQRFILNSEAESIDHINGNTLDNRKKNLRECTLSENSKNKKIRSGKKFIGIYEDKRNGTWKAEVMSNGERIYVGRFSTPEEAASARDIVASKLHGSFANLNKTN